MCCPVKTLRRCHSWTALFCAEKPHDKHLARPGAFAQSLRAAKLLSKHGAPLTLRVQLASDRPQDAETARRLGQVLHATIELV